MIITELISIHWTTLRILMRIAGVDSIALGQRLWNGSRRGAVALSHRNFSLLWIGALASSVGTWMQKVAQAWWIVTMTGSKSAVFLGWDSFLGEVPLLVFATLGGVLADRRDRMSASTRHS